jgi:hypothetical protein
MACEVFSLSDDLLCTFEGDDDDYLINLIHQVKYAFGEPLSPDISMVRLMHGSEIMDPCDTVSDVRGKALTAAIIMPDCNMCHGSSLARFLCNGCGAVRYCCKACRRADSAHQFPCRAVRTVKLIRCSKSNAKRRRLDIGFIHHLYTIYRYFRQEPLM